MGKWVEVKVALVIGTVNLESRIKNQDSDLVLDVRLVVRLVLQKSTIPRGH